MSLIQELITKPFVYEQFGKFRRDPAHPYIRGLQSLRVAELLRRNRCLRKIFESSGRIFITQMFTCLHKQVSEDPEQVDKEKTTFEYFVKFLQQVSRNFFVYFFFIVFY